MRGISRRMEGRTYLGKAIQGCLLLFLSPAVPVSLDNTYSGHNHALSFSFKYLTSSHACLDTYTQTIAYSDTCILLQFYSLTRSYCLTCILCCSEVWSRKGNDFRIKIISHLLATHISENFHDQTFA